MVRNSLKFRRWSHLISPSWWRSPQPHQSLSATWEDFHSQSPRSTMRVSCHPSGRTSQVLRRLKAWQLSSQASLVFQISAWASPWCHKKRLLSFTLFLPCRAPASRLETHTTSRRLPRRKDTSFPSSPSTPLTEQSSNLYTSLLECHV